MYRGTEFTVGTTRSNSKRSNGENNYFNLISRTQQNLALRGHTDENSNLIQFVRLHGDDSDEVRQWLLVK